MSQVTIYHNPRCSKSRQTLELLNGQNIDPQIILYLDNPPDDETLRTLLKKLGLGVRGIIRTSESEYKELGLSDENLEDEHLIHCLSEHPKLLQRPIVVKDDKAAIGRPPENVLAIL